MSGSNVYRILWLVGVLAPFGFASTDATAVSPPHSEAGRVFAGGAHVSCKTGGCLVEVEDDYGRLDYRLLGRGDIIQVGSFLLRYKGGKRLAYARLGRVLRVNALDIGLDLSGLSSIEARKLLAKHAGVASIVVEGSPAMLAGIIPAIRRLRARDLYLSARIVGSGRELAPVIRALCHRWAGLNVETTRGPDRQLIDAIRCASSVEYLSVPLTTDRRKLLGGFRRLAKIDLRKGPDLEYVVRSQGTATTIRSIRLTGNEDRDELCQLRHMPSLRSIDFAGSSSAYEALHCLVGIRGLLGLSGFFGVALGRLQPIIRLSGLASLDLSNSPVRNADLANVGKLPRLRVLDLARTRISDAGMRHLVGLRELEVLDLTGTEIKGWGLRYLAKLSNLKVLRLAGTPLQSGSLRALRDATQLLELDLSETGVGDGDMQSIAQMKRLRSLRLFGVRVTDTGFQRIGRMSRLVELDIEDTSATDRTARVLGKLKALRHLNVSWTGISDRGLGFLRQLRGLRGLRARGTHLTDGAASVLGGLPSLHWLDLCKTRVGDHLLGVLKHEAGLRRLSLCGTDITDASGPVVGTLRNLEYVDVSWTRIGDHTVQMLGGLGSLRVVVMRGTRVSDRGLWCLSYAPQLAEVSAEWTNATYGAWLRIILHRGRAREKGAQQCR